MACASRTVKCLLFLFNLLTALGGLAILVIGVLIFEPSNSALNLISILPIVVGSIVFIISFLGCFGAIRENQCMLLTFSVIMSILFVLQVVVSIFAFLLVTSLDDVLHKALLESMTHYNDEGSGGDVAQQSWDSAQERWRCCGVDSYTDWTAPGGPGLSEPPESCKCQGSSDCNESEGVYAEGCYNDISKVLSKVLYVIGGVTIFIAGIELTEVIFACCLASSIKKQKKSRRKFY